MSNEPTIESMNEVIALFDGWELIEGDPNHVCLSCDKGTQPSGWCTCDQKVDRFQKNGKRVGCSYFRYHSSWDWLMPVVKKIKSMHFDILSQRVFIMQYMEAAGPMNSALVSIDLEKLHAGAYLFIQWYKQQSNEQPTKGND